MSVGPRLRTLRVSDIALSNFLQNGPERQNRGSAGRTGEPLGGSLWLKFVNQRVLMIKWIFEGDL